MKAEVRVEMADARSARAAAKIIGGHGDRGRARVKCAAKGAAFEGVVQSSDFASLRAGTTSLLRDLKVFLDSARAAGARARKKVGY